jgi:peptidoglycan lytic transglycosylase
VIANNWRLNVRSVLALTSLVLATSCSERQESPPQPSPIPYAVAPPVPSAPQAHANTPKGVIASYQGDAYAGHRTASGERYDPNALTAASSTLPIGSSVMVTNPSTGRSVKVRINDRGPNVHGRSLDLSKRAAEEIGMTKKGVARVQVKRVDPKTANRETADSLEGSSSTEIEKSNSQDYSVR